MKSQSMYSKFCSKWQYVLLALLIALAFSGCTKRPDQIVPLESPSADSDMEAVQAKDFTGIVTGLDVEAKKLYLYNVNFEKNSILDYTGATDFFSKSGIQMSASQLTLGEAVDIYADSATGKLIKVQISVDVFTDDNVQNVLVNSNESYLTYEGKNYKYRRGAVIFSDNKLIDIMEISPLDVVTIRGIEGLVYSIVVDQGHGYIRPSHYSDFVGGKMTIAGETILGITKNMLVPIREGTYEVTMKKGDFIGTRSIAVYRDAETKMDMSIFKNQKPNVGQVIFNISPQGALVYVDNKEVDITSPVTLNYGRHKVFAVLEGYTTYSGTLDVQSANPTVKIDLAEENVNVKDNNFTSSSPAPLYDNEHKITVSEPAGAQVYLNGVYKGIAPVSFAKAIGTQTITLSKSGYTTKSYTVEIINDDEDILWNFAALVKK